MNKNIAIVFVLMIICLAFGGFGPSHNPPKNGKPNIVIIVADDMGYADVGFNGCKDIPTPNIDRIAQNGVTFTSGHVCFGVCSPSRAGLLTGRYPFRFGYERNPLYVPTDPNMGLSLDEETIADVLAKQNYNSMLVGKWHLGAHPTLHPLKRGFKEFFGFLGGGHVYFPDSLKITNPLDAHNEAQSYRTKLNRNYSPVEETEYITDAFSREATAFVERNKNTPFLLYLAYNAPHSPLQATQKYLNRFEHIKKSKRRTYAAMVSAIDDGVGLLLDKLQTLGISENTMVFFLSDNGGPLDNGSDNTPLRGKKGGQFEGGIRVPFAMQWPAKIKANTLYKAPIISLDIAQTILENVGSNIKTKHKLDGVNLVPFINGQKKEAPHQMLFWRHYDSNSFAVINANEQKMLWKNDSISLYDLKNEINETTNVAPTNGVLTKQMNDARQNWNKELIPPKFLGLSHKELYDKGIREIPKKK